MPTYLHQRRPFKYASQAALLKKIEEGSKDKLGTNDQKSDVSFQMWLRTQSKAHVELGLDTIFKIPVDNWTRELDIFQNYTISSDYIGRWVRQLQQGISFYDATVLDPNQRVRRLTPCPYDIQNLQYSATYILASLTTKFRIEIVNSVGLEATGIEVLLCVIKRKLHVAVSLQRSLIADLEKLDISQVEGENVPTLNSKIRDLCESIEQAGPSPRDLNQLVIKVYLNTQVEIFATHIRQRYLELENNPSSHTWHNLLVENEDLYLKLKKLWTPEQSKTVSNKEFQNFVKESNNKFNQLKVNGGKNSNNRNNNSSNSEKKKKCWDCGKEGEVKGHTGCTQKGKGLHTPKDSKTVYTNPGKGRNGQKKRGQRTEKPDAPADAPKPGEPEVRTNIDGITEKYCAKCFLRQWRSGPKAHTTSEHRNGRREGAQQNLLMAPATTR